MTPQPSASGLPSLPNTSQGDQPPSASPPLGEETSLTPDPSANARQSQLSMIAASANEMVPQGLSMEQDPSAGLTDSLPRMTPWNQQLSTHEQLLFESLQEHDPSLTAATQRAASFPRPIAMNPNSQAKGFVNEFGNSTKPSKPKVRGRFSASRRREVQEVRKRGACIRCRMLKKPVCAFFVDIPFAITDLYSALETAHVPPVPVLRAHVFGSIRASERVLLRSLSFTTQVCGYSSL